MAAAAITTLTKRPAITPTMDLRLDYMHPAERHTSPSHVSAKVYRNTSNVMFLPRLRLAG